ncbi:hypothetical protein [Streptomyces sp. DW26H14]|uniref:hypothetical protein n=1 Tax=Streptomyces sp. DW26H14 TaxID=3435395 RepID=UPI00403DF271
MGLIPMLCGVLFPPAMLGVVVAMGRFEEVMMREPGPDTRRARRRWQRWTALTARGRRTRAVRRLRAEAPGTR